MEDEDAIIGAIVAGTATAYSYSILVPRNCSYGLEYKFTSTGTVAVDVIVEHANALPTTEAAADTDYVEGEGVSTLVSENDTNVHFVAVNTPADVTMLTWERGSGATQACGTGAAAVCVAGVLTGRSERAITVHLPGGDLQLEWRESDNHVYMTGPAVEIFTGDWPLP